METNPVPPKTNKEKIEAIKRWQNCEYVHPLTCDNDSNHKLLIAKEINKEVILICKDCNYKQNFIPDPVLKIDIDEYVEQMKGRFTSLDENE